MEPLRPASPSRRACPRIADRALLIGRVWLPRPPAPRSCASRRTRVYDLSRVAPTASGLCSNWTIPSRAIRGCRGPAALGSTAEILANSAADGRPRRPAAGFLAPCDLQAIKASGVTFVSSMLERVIEEQTRGDPAKAESGAGSRSSR